MKTFLAILLTGTLAATMFLGSCELLSDDNGTLGGDPSPMGTVNNEWDVTTIEGVGNPKVIVTSQNGDVSTVKYSADITDPTLLAIVKAMPDVEVIGNKASVSRKYRITKEGFQSVYDEGSLTIVKYGAKVGDTYSLEHNGKTLERKVTHVSTTDDYPWGFMDIKVTKVEESGRGIPGVSKFEFIGNHRFGIVGLTIHFEDGSTKTIGIFSDATNDWGGIILSLSYLWHVMKPGEEEPIFTTLNRGTFPKKLEYYLSIQGRNQNIHHPSRIELNVIVKGVLWAVQHCSYYTNFQHPGVYWKNVAWHIQGIGYQFCKIIRLSSQNCFQVMAGSQYDSVTWSIVSNSVNVPDHMERFVSMRNSYGLVS